MNQNTDTVPRVNKTAFSCPHCNAYTTQQWSMLYTDSYPETQRTPPIPDPSQKKKWANDEELDADERTKLFEWVDKMRASKPFLYQQRIKCDSQYQLMNLNISQCFNCKDIAVWVCDQLIYPSKKIEIQPNQDLPSHIKQIFEEAREIVSSSAKGAAALLRLSIQYICMELGESGKDLDKDIASLVAKGLDPLVQKALDVVRVVGNEAVHPGQIDLHDKRDTALHLFDLVNLISNQMITQPKKVKALYDNLPKGKLEHIEQRNKKAVDNNKNT